MLEHKGKHLILIVSCVVFLMIIVGGIKLNTLNDANVFPKQINNYLGVNQKSVLTPYTIKSKVSLKYSSEGAYLFGVYSMSDEIQYLSVDICGETGRKVHEYNFQKNCIIYSTTVVEYNEPFYVNPYHVAIRGVELRKYIIYDSQMYDYTEDVKKAVSKEFLDSTIEDLFDFVCTLNEFD